MRVESPESPLTRQDPMTDQIASRSLRPAGAAADRQAWIAPLVFLALFMAWMLWLRQDLFFHANLVPDGDFAADDLLIYRAKTFHLLTGNYSRVGFNHPGPFFLQVAALSEVVFHDWLHLFPSYWAAQIFGIALLHGVALTFLFRLWLLVTRDLAASIVAVLAVMVTIGLATDLNVFIAMWNPHDYVAGAVMLATGLIGLWARGIRWAPLAAVGAVSLVHGHASFVGLVPIMLAVFFVQLALANGLKTAPSAALGAVRRAPLAAAATLAILVLGALPILVHLAQQGPTYIREYLSFARQSQVNPPVAALRFVWSYIPFGGVWLLLFLLSSKMRPETLRLYRASLAVFACGFCAALFYAWKGVDNFDFRYLIFWSLAFFGLALAAASTVVIELAGGKTARVVMLLAAVVGMWAAFRHKPVGGQNPAVADNLRAAAARFRAITPPGQTIGLSLEAGPGRWEAAWPNVAGVAAILQRENSRPFCIIHRWHILFTAELKCGPNDHVTRTLSVTGADFAPAGSVVAPMNTAVAYATNAPLDDVKFPGMAAAGVRLDGDWAQPEEQWDWSSGPSPTLAIDNSHVPAQGLLKIQGMVFSDGKHPQTVSLLDDHGRELTSVTATGGEVVLTAPVTASAPGRLELRLKVAHPVSPASLGLGGDPRLLGFAVKSLSLTPAG